MLQKALAGKTRVERDGAIQVINKITEKMRNIPELFAGGAAVENYWSYPLLFPISVICSPGRGLVPVY